MMLLTQTPNIKRALYEYIDYFRADNDFKQRKNREYKENVRRIEEENWGVFNFDKHYFDDLHKSFDMIEKQDEEQRKRLTRILNTRLKQLPQEEASKYTFQNTHMENV